MTILTLKSRAKVNLTLDILGRESSGYHRIQTIFHEVEKPYDTLIFEEVSDSTIWKSDFYRSRVWLEPHGLKVTNDATNTILKAAQLLKDEYGLKDKGMRIILEKRIPLESGLGGAASNAAITLKALNNLWGINLTTEQLLTHAAKIGMDVPFFILGGCALGMHYGEHLMPLPTLDTLGLAIEIIPTKIAVSTAEAYKNLNLSRCGKNANKTLELVKILKGEKPIDRTRALDLIEPLLHNDFEIATNSPTHLTGSGGAHFKLVNTPASPPARSSA